MTGLVTLPPSRPDLELSRAVARAATPRSEKATQLLTWLADEKIMLGAVALFWLDSRLRNRAPQLRCEADQMLLAVAAAGALPHVFKRMIDRKRPDRVVVHGRRRGIPRSGNAWDSFPSGHALHIGAIAGPLLRVVPRQARAPLGAGLLALAASRIWLLAHYASEVAAGLLLGAGLGKVVQKLVLRWRRR
jgi:membrane-associated phospholipid phosphatase